MSEAGSDAALRVGVCHGYFLHDLLLEAHQCLMAMHLRMPAAVQTPAVAVTAVAVALHVLTPAAAAAVMVPHCRLLLLLAFLLRTCTQASNQQAKQHSWKSSKHR
jgi:hypothetical protein